MPDWPRAGLSPHVAAWGGVSRVADLGGPVHYVDFGGAAEAPRVVLVHGLGGSHLNWCLLAPLLVPHARVLALDLVGFGLTYPEGRSATVQANAALVARFVREVAGGPAVLVGNSMGGMVSILATAAQPGAVTGLTLIAPALPWVRRTRPDPLVVSTFMLYVVPGIGERYLAQQRATLPARELVRRVLDLACADPSVVPQDLVAASVALMEQRRAVPGLDAALLSAARSMLWVSARHSRYWAAMAAIRAPVLLLNGAKDRLVSVRSAREAAAHNPGWRFHVFPDIGHVPQLEVPDAVAGLLQDWLVTAAAPSG